MTQQVNTSILMPNMQKTYIPLHLKLPNVKSSTEAFNIFEQNYRKTGMTSDQLKQFCHLVCSSDSNEWKLCLAGVADKVRYFFDQNRSALERANIVQLASREEVKFPIRTVLREMHISELAQVSEQKGVNALEACEQLIRLANDSPQFGLPVMKLIIVLCESDPSMYSKSCLSALNVLGVNLLGNDISRLNAKEKLANFLFTLYHRSEKFIPYDQALKNFGAMVKNQDYWLPHLRKLQLRNDEFDDEGVLQYPQTRVESHEGLIVDTLVEDGRRPMPKIDVKINYSPEFDLEEKC